MVTLAKTPDRWVFQHFNSRENLFKLGGEPTWVQPAEVLTCPLSGEKMDFIMQLDSELPAEVEDDIVQFGLDAGICYVFWCDRTKVSGYLMQST